MQGQVIVVPMETPIIHTEANGYQCHDRLCPCWDADYEQQALEDERNQAQERNQAYQCSDGSWW